jgi:hypothetical protein
MNCNFTFEDFNYGSLSGKPQIKDFPKEILGPHYLLQQNESLSGKPQRLSNNH